MNDLCFTHKNKKRGVALITFAESVYHQTRSGCISSMQSIVYHHYGVSIHAKA